MLYRFHFKHTAQEKITNLQENIKVFESKIEIQKSTMKPTLSASKLAEGQVDIEIWQQKIRNVEIEIACFEELCLNWQRK